jgi:hypothetical protein
MLAFEYVRPPRVDLSVPMDPDVEPTLAQQAADLDATIAAHDKLVVALAKPEYSELLHWLMYEQACQHLRVVMGDMPYRYDYDGKSGVVVIPPNFSDQAAVEHLEVCVYHAMGRKMQ